jgi:hypothetical protein
MTATAGIAGAFEPAIGETPGRIHTAKEEILLGPNPGVGPHFENLFGAAEAGLETDGAGFLDMETRSFNCLFEAHAEIEEIDRDLQNRGADAVRTAGP